MVAGGGALEAYFERFFSHRESQLRKPRKRRQPLTCSSGRSLNLATTAAPPRPCVQWSAVRIKRKFCEGVLVTKVCSVLLIAALLRANTLHDQQHAKEEQRQAELRVGARGFTT